MRTGDPWIAKHGGEAHVEYINESWAPGVRLPLASIDQGRTECYRRA